MRVGEVFRELLALRCVISQCGSTITCDPAPTDTDTDFLILCDGQGTMSNVAGFLTGSAKFWMEGGTEHYQRQTEEGFVSFRRGKLNFILTQNPEFHRKHRSATEYCRMYNIMDKEERIRAFQFLLYGNFMEDRK